MKTKNLTDLERVCIAALLVIGKDSLDMVFRLLKPNSTVERSEIFHKMALRWWNNPVVKSFANDLRAIHLQRSEDLIEMESEEDEPLTKSFLIKELRLALKATTDPGDRASIALKLADLTGLKGKDTESREKEQRRFYLPFVSHCRSCKIMQVFKDISQQHKEEINL